MLEINTEINYQDGQATLNKTTMAEIAKATQAKQELLASKIVLILRKTVFQVLIYALKICNVDTGRLRGGFTPYMKKWGETEFEGFMTAPAEGGETRKTKGKGYSPDQAEAGAAESSYIDSDTAVTIMNNVKYAGYVDAKTGLVGRILARAELLLNKNITNYLAALDKGGVPEVPPGSNPD